VRREFVADVLKEIRHSENAVDVEIVANYEKGYLMKLLLRDNILFFEKELERTLGYVIKEHEQNKILKNTTSFWTQLYRYWFGYEY